MAWFAGLNTRFATLLHFSTLRIHSFVVPVCDLNHVYLMHHHICLYTCINRHRNVSASSKFQALTDLLQQLGFVASERNLLQQNQEQLSGVRGTKRRRRNENVIEEVSAEEEEEEEEEDEEEDEEEEQEDDENDENKDKDDDNEEEISGEKRNATPPQKFILFAQNR